MPAGYGAYPLRGTCEPRLRAPLFKPRLAPDALEKRLPQLPERKLRELVMAFCVAQKLGAALAARLSETRRERLDAGRDTG